MRDTEKERDAETQEEGEAGSMQGVGLDPGSPGSRPGPKAGAKPLSPPGIPELFFLHGVSSDWALTCLAWCVGGRKCDLTSGWSVSSPLCWASVVLTTWIKAFSFQSG